MGLVGALALLAAALGEIAVVTWAIADAATRPTSAWQRAGQNKVLWIALQPLGLIFIVGLVVPVVYLIWIRPSVRRAQLADALDQPTVMPVAEPNPGTWTPPTR
jgi:hypothetical protein